MLRPLLRFPVPFGVLALFLLAVPAIAQAPLVTSVSPPGGGLRLPLDTPVTVAFDRAVEPTSVTPATFRVFGRWSGPMPGAFSFENDGALVTFTPATSFFLGETVTVQLAEGIQAAGGTSLAAPYAWSFWTGRPVIPTGPFVEVETLDLRLPGEGNIISYGAYAGDLDDDEDSDLAIPNEAPSDVRVLLNDGAGHYGPVAVHQLVDPNSLPSTNEGTDLDGDGHIDLLVGHGGNDRLSVLLGDGDGGFRAIDAYTSNGSGVRGLAVFDADGDGHDDAVTANRFGSNLSFFKGIGDGTLAAPVAFDAGGDGETALAAADANGDGILDLFVGAINSDEIFVMLGDGDGGFTVSDQIETTGGPWMLAAGDLDGDGDADVAAASAYSGNLDIAFGDGAGGFDGPLASYDSGSFTLAVDIGDLDGDGDLDAVTSNFSSRDFVVFLNDGSGGFALEQRLPADGSGSCVVIHDRDNDGLAVEITGVDEIADRLFFYEWSSVPVGVEPEAPEAGLALDVLGNPAFGVVSLRVTNERPRDVRLRVLDVRGREVAVLLDGALGVGTHVVAWDAGALPSGVYVARLEAGGQAVTRRLTRVR